MNSPILVPSVPHSAHSIHCNTVHHCAIFCLSHTMQHWKALCTVHCALCTLYCALDDKQYTTALWWVHSAKLFHCSTVECGIGTDICFFVCLLSIYLFISVFQWSTVGCGIGTDICLFVYLLWLIYLFVCLYISVQNCRAWYRDRYLFVCLFVIINIFVCLCISLQHSRVWYWDKYLFVCLFFIIKCLLVCLCIHFIGAL